MHIQQKQDIIVTNSGHGQNSHNIQYSSKGHMIYDIRKPNQGLQQSQHPKFITRWQSQYPIPTVQSTDIPTYSDTLGTMLMCHFKPHVTVIAFASPMS